QEFLGNEGTGCTRCMQMPWLTIFRVAPIADLAARRQIPAPHKSSQSEYHMQPPLSCFASTTLPTSPFLAVNAQTGRFIIEQATSSEGTKCAFYPRSKACSEYRDA
ncbi:hypothetical protein K443DRAFT_108554, partial [Laccaria amethystina LaAM-08-1]